jgi:hypothetical protein
VLRASSVFMLVILHVQVHFLATRLTLNAGNSRSCSCERPSTNVTGTLEFGRLNVDMPTSALLESLELLLSDFTTLLRPCLVIELFL